MSERRRIIVVIRGEVAVVSFTDKKIVDSAAIEEMAEEVFELVDKEHFKHLLLNFDGVAFLSSEALNKLILIERKIKEVGGVLRMCCLKEEIREIFDITQLSRFFDIRKTEAEALKAFGIND